MRSSTIKGHVVLVIRSCRNLQVTQEEFNCLSKGLKPESRTCTFVNTMIHICNVPGNFTKAGIRH